MKISRIILAFIWALCMIPTQTGICQTPELVIQKGHIGNVNDVVVTPDGSFVLTGSDDCTVKFWDLKSGKEIRTIDVFSQPVKKIAVSPTGNVFACGSNKKEKALKIFELSTSKELISLPAVNGEILDISFSTDGSKLLAVIEEDGFVTKVQVYDWEKGLLLKSPDLSSNEFVRTARFAMGDKFIITAGKRLSNVGDQNISLWNTISGSREETFKNTPADINQVLVSNDGASFFAGGNNLQVWDISTKSIKTTFNASSAFISTSGDSKKAVICRGKDIVLKDLESGNDVGIIKNAHQGMVSKAIFVKDNNYVVSVGKDKDVKLWNTDAFLQIPMFSKAPVESISEFVIAEKGNVIFYLLESGAIVKFDIRDGKFSPFMRNEDGTPLFKTSDISWHESSRTLFLVPEASKDVIAFSVRYSKAKKYTVSTSYINKVDTDPSSTLLAVAAKDNSVIIYSLTDSVQKFKMVGHINAINCVAFSADGKKIYSAGADKTLKEWDVLTGTLIKSYSVNQPVNHIAVSPDNTLIATSGGDKNNSKSTTQELILWGTDMIPKILSGHTKPTLSSIFSSDSKKLISTSADNSAILWDLATLMPIKKIDRHTRAVTSAGFINPEGILVTASTDGLCSFYTPAGDPIFSLALFSQGKEHVVFTPENFYTCTRDGIKNLHFLMNNNVYLFEQFDLRLNRPDIVASVLPKIDKRLVAIYKEAYIKRLKKMGFTQERLKADFHIPVVSIANEEKLQYNSSTKDIEIEIQGSDESENLSKLNLWVNDVPVYGIKGFDLATNPSTKVNLKLPLRLSEGVNKIQVSLLNASGGESLKATKFIYYKNPVPQKDRLFILTVGVSKFKDPQRNLDYSAKDARDMISLFEKHKESFAEIKTMNISDEQATRENIIKTKSFLQQSNEDDYVMVFVASHGLLDKDFNYYLATYDTDFTNPALKGLPYDELEMLLDGIKSRKKTLLIDACHSGEVDEDSSATQNTTIATDKEYSEDAGIKVKSRGFKTAGSFSLSVSSAFEVMKELFADLRRGTGATVISSAGGAEYALESSQWNNGVFTYSIIEGIETKKADLNKDGSVTVSELKEYTSRRVQKLTGGKQNPTSRTENLDSNFKIL